MHTKKIYLVWLSLSLLAFGCEPEKLERGKEMAVEAERHKVKRITQEDMEKQAILAGDTIIRLVEGAFLQLAEGQPQAQALFVAQPDKLPTVSSILQRYNATLTRTSFASEAEAQAYQRQAQGSSSEAQSKASAELQVREGVVQYQRPIEIRRRNCASCDEPSLLDYTATSLDQLRVFSAQGKPDGFAEGQLRGVWKISFPREKLIEQITLKTKPSRRGKLFSKTPDSTAKR
ncbi:hypothetical protein ACD591_18430 [Rufibacter glacialis]|uniref:Uncharacterized protein n=1 Tax=Rufibacter glacialis TaxID=1259555 RepID=A0A5M8QUR4_9BACT|nr:hypothetical protein [Rufibacter glacialis]KAA6438193.1 hypothetical protein FOE74_00720 [Rufibacter glacialis]GGK89427.1 hypothetical protein GCM10011405_41430 [Rufibacter glacialis]